MRINKLTKYGMLSLAVLSGGCTTSSHISGGEIVRNECFVELNPIKYNNKVNNKHTKNLDDIILDLKDLNVELAYREKLDRITKMLKIRSYGEAHSMIKSYAKELERNKDGDNLSRIKEFNYVRYDYVSEKVETKEKTNFLIGGGLWLTAVTFSPLFILDAMVSDSDYSGMAEGIKEKSKSSKTKPIEDAHYIKVLVNPYYGTEKVIDEFVPLSEVK